MNSRLIPSLLSIAFAVACSICLPSASAQVLLSDDFNDATVDPNDLSTSSYIDSRIWRVPPGGDGASYGLTTVKTALADLATTDGNAAVLQLNRYFPANGFAISDPNDYRVSGQEFQARSSYAIGGGLIWEARVRLGSSRQGKSDPNGVPISATPPGLINGAFLFDVTNAFNSAGDPLVRDELDFELLSKQTTSILTNTYNDDGFVGAEAAGSPLLVNNPVSGFSPYDYHNYKMVVTPNGASNKVEYFVDNTLIRTVNNSNVADEAMTPHFNLWMSDSGFATAFDTNLGVDDPNDDEIYTASIDSVSLRRVNTQKGSNLVVNGQFTDDPESITGWTPFGEAFLSSENGGFGDDVALKTFGRFAGAFDASGVHQDVAVSAGDEVSLTFVVNSADFDDIVGNGSQFAEAWIRFEDSGGNILARRTAVPLDNRDPALVQDEWLPMAIEGTAPAGTTNVNIQLAHVANDNNGSIFWDDVQLSILSAVPSNADFDGSGFVDAPDFFIWQQNVGLTGQTDNSNGDANGDGLVDRLDLDVFNAEYGNAAPALFSSVASVPEPSSLLLGLVSVSVLLGVRRRG